MWDKIKAYLLTWLVPLAIRILSSAIDQFWPDVKTKVQDWFKAEYAEAKAEGDFIKMAIIADIIAKLFGFVIEVDPDDAAYLALMTKRVLESGCESVKDELVTEDEEPTDWWKGPDLGDG